MVPSELRRILRFVDGYVRERGYAPSYAEIAEAVELPSVAHVQYRLDKLETLGFLTRVPKRARSLRVLRMPPADRLRAGISLGWPGLGGAGPGRRDGLVDAASLRARIRLWWRRVRAWIAARLD